MRSLAARRSNCTFMELKFFLNDLNIFGYHRSNCTFMELKSRTGLLHRGNKAF